MKSPEPQAGTQDRPGIPSRAALWRTPLPHLADRPGTRLLCRTLLTMFHSHVRALHGLNQIDPANDPFLLVLNHSQRPEALLLPAWLCFHRGGRMVHFMADWNFLLVPGLAAIIRAHDPIVVTRKAARPEFLNRLRPKFMPPLPPFAEARRRLGEGRSVGLFPEGTINRHPTQLLRGLQGAARLGIEAGIGVIPAGIRFPGVDDSGRVGDRSRFEVEFGQPLAPPAAGDNLETLGERVQHFHHEIMTAISTLSRKRWQAHARRTKYDFDQD